MKRLLLLTIALVCARDLVAAEAAAYTAKGVVEKVGVATVVIKHEAISNYMAAMTMPFEVKEASLLRGLKPGDVVSFHLVVTPREAWIDQIAKTGVVSNPAKAAELLERAPDLLEEGDPAPDFQFTNELGRTARLSDFKGQAIAFTFFFTSCPLPNFCPRMTANFAEAQEQLKAMPNAPANWHLVSISFDPKNDTPERLRFYAQAGHYDSSRWSFATADAPAIHAFAGQFGEQFWADSGSISHNLRTVVVNAKGRIQRIFVGNGWTGAELVSELVKAAKP